MTKAIIFDCFGVLYSSGRTVLLSYVPVENHADFNDLYKQYDYGFIDETEFRHAQLEFTGLETAKLNAILQETYVRNQPLLDYIAELKSHYKIGVLSNVGAPFFHSLFSKSEQTELFDNIVLSSEVGMVKPTAEIYELAAQNLEVTPEECFFVDDVEENVRGAKVVGMKGMTFYDVASLRREVEAL